MWYSVNFSQLVLLLLPTFLRKPALFGYIRALVSPVQNLHYRWYQMRLANIDKLSYNSQVCNLRRCLNDKYDSDLRRITIDDTLEVEQDYIYTISENSPVYLGVLYLEQEFNYADSDVDFLVNVPSEVLSSRENEITATINLYRLAGKSFKLLAI